MISAPYDAFGYAVDYSNDRLIVGAYEEDEDVSGGNTQSGAGSAYILKRMHKMSGQKPKK